MEEEYITANLSIVNHIDGFEFCALQDYSTILAPKLTPTLDHRPRERGCRLSSCLVAGRAWEFEWTLDGHLIITRWPVNEVSGHSKLECLYLHLFCRGWNGSVRPLICTGVQLSLILLRNHSHVTQVGPSGWASTTTATAKRDKKVLTIERFRRIPPTSCNQRLDTNSSLSRHQKANFLTRLIATIAIVSAASAANAATKEWNRLARSMGRKFSGNSRSESSYGSSSSNTILLERRGKSQSLKTSVASGDDNDEHGTAQRDATQRNATWRQDHGRINEN